MSQTDITDKTLVSVLQIDLKITFMHERESITKVLVVITNESTINNVNSKQLEDSL